MQLCQHLAVASAVDTSWILFESGAAGHTPTNFAPEWSLLPITGTKPPLRRVTGHPLKIYGRKLVGMKTGDVDFYLHYYVTGIDHPLVCMWESWLFMFHFALSAVCWKVFEIKTPTWKILWHQRHGFARHLKCHGLQVPRQLRHQFAAAGLHWSKMRKANFICHSCATAEFIWTCLDPDFTNPELVKGLASCWTSRDQETAFGNFFKLSVPRGLSTSEIHTLTFELLMITVLVKKLRAHTSSLLQGSMSRYMNTSLMCGEYFTIRKYLHIYLLAYFGSREKTAPGCQGFFTWVSWYLNGWVL